MINILPYYIHVNPFYPSFLYERRFEGSKFHRHICIMILVEVCCFKLLACVGKIQCDQALEPVERLIKPYIYTRRSHLAVQLLLIGYALIANNKYQFPFNYNKISHDHFLKNKQNYMQR